jgi:hypothetical protein
LFSDEHSASEAPYFLVQVVYAIILNAPEYPEHLIEGPRIGKRPLRYWMARTSIGNPASEDISIFQDLWNT